MIDFAGDALVCIFLDRGMRSWTSEKKRTQEERRRCCTRGVNCGSTLSKFQVDNVHAHVGVSYGTVALGLLGGYGGKHTYLMNGDCVDRLAACLEMAGVGEIVVTQEVHATLSEDQHHSFVFTPKPRRSSLCRNKDDRYFQVTKENNKKKRRASTFYDQASSSSDNDSTFASLFDSCKGLVQVPVVSRAGELDVTFTARRRMIIYPSRGSPSKRYAMQDRCTPADIISCVPQPVRDALTAGTFRGLSELRTVTTLFLKLDTYSTDKYRNLSDLQPFVLDMQVCLEECGGMLRQIIIDDKGCVLIGLWGVPGASYPGNCSRAVRCAWMMKAEASKSHHSVSIGITTGSVYCGVIGTEYRRDYVAIGKSVNLSARLMSRAKGRILLDESTYDKLPLDVAYNTKPVVNLSMKGVPDEDIYYSFASAVAPAITDSIVHSDKVMVFSREVCKQVAGVLDMVDTVMAHFSGGADRSLHDPHPSPVFVIKGCAGSGKSATLHHLIRRVKSHLATHHGEVRQTLGPLYVPVKVEMDRIRYGAIRRIIEAVWTCSGFSTQESRMNVVVGFLLATYSLEAPEVLEITVFPVIRDALSLTLPYPAHILQSRGTAVCADIHTFPNGNEIMAALTRYVLESAGAPVVALDDAHNMSTESWDVLTRVLLSGCRTLLVLTLSVRDAYKGMDPYHGQLAVNNLSPNYIGTSFYVTTASTDILNSVTITETHACIDTTVAIT